MKKSLSTTLFWPGHGFYSRLGPKQEDWEEVPFPEDGGMDEYESAQVRSRPRHPKS